MQWEISRMVIYMFLVITFFKVYTEFKRCVFHTMDVSYCLSMPSENDHNSDGHRHE